MQVTVSAAALADALEDVKASASTRPALPVLGGVHLTAKRSAVTVATTDLELTTVVTIPAEVASPGEAVVPFPIFSSVYKAMLGATAPRVRKRASVERRVGLAVADGYLQIRPGEADGQWHDLRLLVAADYPKLPTVGRERVAVIGGPELRRAAAKVATAVSTDVARPVLTGIYLEPGLDTATLAATDSYRLAVHDLPLTWRAGRAAVRRYLREQRTSHLPGLLIPHRAMKHVVKLLGDADEILVAADVEQVAFLTAERRITSRLIEGEYPKYRALIPTDGPCATVERVRLEAALAQTAPYCQNNTPVRAVFAEDGLKLTSDLQEVGRGGDRVPADYNGEPVTTAFNHRYLHAGVTAIDDANLVLRVHDGLKPVVLQGAASKAFTYLLMPTRLPA